MPRRTRGVKRRAAAGGEGRHGVRWSVCVARAVGVAVLIGVVALLVGTVRRLPVARAQGAEPAVFLCPMHPEVTARAPGACPKCGLINPSPVEL